MDNGYGESKNKNLNCDLPVVWAVVQLVGGVGGREGRVEHEVGVGTARAGEGGLPP
jgi:hypothetical protein